MLLGDRDKQRRIHAPEGITLSRQGHQLLQHLAVWLVRGGQTELSHTEAELQLERVMTVMSKVRKQGSPKEILNHLLNRTDLLQERSVDVVQFVHRTFQDYPAAKELVDEGNLTSSAGMPPMSSGGTSFCWRSDIVVRNSSAVWWRSARGRRRVRCVKPGTS
jgi:predicted NACHT family NTPase